MARLCRHFGDRPELGRAVRRIAADEDAHLAHGHEEPLCLAGVHAVHRYERLVGRRRTTTLTMPARRDPLGSPPTPEPAGT
ncbi:hypothetical protein ACLMNJ_11255 [Streptomyces seoulensis]